MSETSWTEDRIALLHQLFDEKRSASIIAQRMGISRNAVIGKLSRLRLAREKQTKTAEEIAAAEQLRRDSQTMQQKARRAKARGEVAEIAAPLATTPIAEPAKFGGPLGIPFADLEPFSKRRSNQCRYMAAEEPGPDYRVCGVETAPGESWCAHCKTIVHDYRKPTDAEHARLRNLSKFMKRRHAMRSGV